MVYIYILWLALQISKAKKSISTAANGCLNFSTSSKGKMADHQGLLIKLNHIFLHEYIKMLINKTLPNLKPGFLNKIISIKVSGLFKV